MESNHLPRLSESRALNPLWRCRKDSNPDWSTYSLLFRRQRWYGSKLLVGRPELESGSPSY